ncbi:hypothetical protein EAH68_05640 [Corynebacterium hylobatis]|uniref:Alpha/beta hydrolase n=1 Tax=Corynebacterium hylobatis TaxID=1859290 RepID=A0A430I0G4_9CORY|nr:hypothetical protein [Corynebacterium hylobatis]RSZ64469.1 hypothetical protein EAH68_05640 [Corynebacterium hylobatis]
MGQRKPVIRRRTVALTAFLLVALLITAGVISSILAEKEAGFDAAVDCTPYGIPAGDPLAQAEPVMVSTSPQFPFQSPPPPTGAPWETDDFEETEGVSLGRDFAGGHRGGTVGSYHLFTRGVDFSRPVGLLVHLHGDGAEEYHVPGGLSACLAAVAQTHNMITLIPRTPDLRSMTWWRDLRRNVAWVDSLVAEVSAEYGVADGDTWWMGYSGGAELISYGLIPYRAESVTGGAIMLGGGGAPEGVSPEVTPELRESISLHWVTGLRDDGSDPREPFDAIAAAREGSQWYRERGFARVHTSFPSEYDHFTLPQAAILRDILSAAD